MTTPVFYSPAHLGHNPTMINEWGEPALLFEQTIRAENILDTLRAAPNQYTIASPTPWGRAPIDAVHDPGLINFLERAWREFQDFRPQTSIVPDSMLHPAVVEGIGKGTVSSKVWAEIGYWCFEAMTPLMEGTYAAACAAVEVALSATAHVLDTGSPAYGLCRPPGHHAPRAGYGGYCYFNNAAIAAHHVASTTGSRVTVLDVDYHHGNGTQQIFYERDDVQYVSLHADPNRAYPYVIGYADEIGTGRGRGHNLNLPLTADVDDDAYCATLAVALDTIVKFDPALVVVSLGVDTFVADPLGDFAVTTGGFARQGAMISALQRPTVVLQEGGYAWDAIGANVDAFLNGVTGLAG